MTTVPQTFRNAELTTAPAPTLPTVAGVDATLRPDRVARNRIAAERLMVMLLVLWMGIAGLILAFVAVSY